MRREPGVRSSLIAEIIVLDAILDRSLVSSYRADSELANERNAAAPSRASRPRVATTGSELAVFGSSSLSASAS